MRTSATPVALVALAALLPALVACGSETGSAVEEPALDRPAPASGSPVPETSPAAEGPVRSLGLVTVLDEGRPVFCFRPVAAVTPPACDGEPLRGWRWRDHPIHERSGDVRWGSFALSGTWDGTALTVTEAVPAALYDVPADATPARPTPVPAEEEPELAEVAEQTGVLPGHLASYVADGQVWVEVVHDDGSLQEWADETWEPGVVRVVGQLVGTDPS